MTESANIDTNISSPDPSYDKSAPSIQEIVQVMAQVAESKTATKDFSLTIVDTALQMTNALVDMLSRRYLILIVRIGPTLWRGEDKEIMDVYQLFDLDAEGEMYLDELHPCITRAYNQCTVATDSSKPLQ